MEGAALFVCLMALGGALLAWLDEMLRDGPADR
jgi:hypothetical protein